MGPLETLFAYGGEVSVLRFAIFVLVFAIVYAAAQLTHIFKGSKRLSFVVALAVSAIGVLGFSDHVVVAIMTGYSAFGLVLLYVLPILGLIAIFFWRSRSTTASIVKLVAAALLLGFIRITVAAFASINPMLLTTQVGGVTPQQIVSLLEFVIYGALFFFGIDLAGKLLFPKGQAS